MEQFIAIATEIAHDNPEDLKRLLIMTLKALKKDNKGRATGVELMSKSVALMKRMKASGLSVDDLLKALKVKRDDEIRCFEAYLDIFLDTSVFRITTPDTGFPSTVIDRALERLNNIAIQHNIEVVATPHIEQTFKHFLADIGLLMGKLSAQQRIQVAEAL